MRQISSTRMLSISCFALSFPVSDHDGVPLLGDNDPLPSLPSETPYYLFWDRDIIGIRADLANLPHGLKLIITLHRCLLT